MDRSFDVVAIGEYLVDFSPVGTGEMGNPKYEMNPGGAPANCLAACAALGGRTAMIAAVGRDMFGRFLSQKAEEAGIGTDGIQKAGERTTLVFVSLDEKGEREFAFIRSPGADTCIRAEKIDRSLLEDSKYLHFGSLSLSDEPARSATEFAVGYAKEHGALISYDPNYRPRLWSSAAAARERLAWGLAQADIVKMSEEELWLLTKKGTYSIEAGADEILGLGVRELYITAGSRGAFYFTPSERGFVKAFPVGAVDTTGCGDAFTGGILYQNCRSPGRPMAEKTAFANAIGALCATKPGGMCAMPGPEAAAALLQSFEQGRGRETL